MNVWAFTYDQKRLLQLLSTLSQNFENTMKYLYNKQDFFFLAYDASHSFFTHAPKKKKRLSPLPPTKKKNRQRV